MARRVRVTEKDWRDLAALHRVKAIAEDDDYHAMRFRPADPDAVQIAEFRTAYLKETLMAKLKRMPPKRRSPTVEQMKKWEEEALHMTSACHPNNITEMIKQLRDRRDDNCTLPRSPSRLRKIIKGSSSLMKRLRKAPRTR
jgi:hypothetical protein